MLPQFSPQQAKVIEKQLKENDLTQKHNILKIEKNILKQVLEYYGLEVKTMGRDLNDDPEFFATCTAAAIYVASLPDLK